MNGEYVIIIERLRSEHLAQVTSLVNHHLGAIVPGWAVPEAWLAGYLQRNPGEYVVDPWVVERTTLVALERQSVEAVAHVLLYGSAPEVNSEFHGVAEIDWFLASPDAAEASAHVLSAAAEQAAAWSATALWLAGGPPVGPFSGIPDVWPHITAAIEAAGYLRDPGRVESVYGGELAGVTAPGDPPLPTLSVYRSTGRWGARFDVFEGEVSIGYCDIVTDLTEGGALPALRGWAELAELEVVPERRNRGVGSWLLRHAVAWARFGGCERLLLITAAEDESAGAGRFYSRFGWERLTRLEIGWQARRPVPSRPDAQASG